MSVTLPSEPVISIVAIGVTRETALQPSQIFKRTPYHIVAVLDQTESPRVYQYNPQNLGLLLHTLYPRPQALVAGTAISRLVPNIQATWDEYVRWSREQDGDDAKDRKMTFIPVSRARRHRARA